MLFKPIYQRKIKYADDDGAERSGEPGGEPGSA
jgi:hypothetical protein